VTTVSPTGRWSPLLDLTSLDCPFRWKDLFPGAGPVELEIGSGKGRFLIEAAQRWPDSNFLGVENAGRYLRRSVERVAKRGLRNVRLARADGRDILARWIPRGGLRRMHIYFPDPWPKKRHLKRRIICPDFPGWAADALEPGGEILLGTDHEGYVESIREIMGSSAAFGETPWDPLKEDWILTNYAVKWAAMGRRLHWFRYHLEGGGGAFRGDGTGAPC
jgi:tRNA (guanine-N7-)-methyltransferase